MRSVMYSPMDCIVKIRAVNRLYIKKKALPNCGNKDGNIVHVLKNCLSTSVGTVLKCME